MIKEVDKRFEAERLKIIGYSDLVMTVINTITLLVERKEYDFKQDLYCCLSFIFLMILQ